MSDPTWLDWTVVSKTPDEKSLVAQGNPRRFRIKGKRVGDRWNWKVYQGSMLASSDMSIGLEAEAKRLAQCIQDAWDQSLNSPRS